MRCVKNKNSKNKNMYLSQSYNIILGVLGYKNFDCRFPDSI